MKTLTLDGLTKKIAAIATSATKKLYEQEKHSSSSFISKAFLLPMILQTFRLSVACTLTLLAIALTAISVVYTNIKELKK